jgi:hypothetical protein
MEKENGPNKRKERSKKIKSEREVKKLKRKWEKEIKGKKIKLKKLIKEGTKNELTYIRQFNLAKSVKDSSWQKRRTPRDVLN